MERFDVVVIGLGPGGASAARTAAEAGLRVLGIDKNKAVGVPVQCAEFIPLPMGAYAQAGGVFSQKIVGMKSFLPSGDRHDSDFPGMMIERDKFDQAIAARAEAAGAQFWMASRIVGLDTAARTVTVRRGDDETEVGYEVLVAADGPHSPVAKLMGLPPLEIVQTRQYTVPLLKPYEDTDIWLSDEYPGGYAWLFPKGDVANLGLGADREFEADLKVPLDRLHQQLVAAGLLGEDILYRTGGAIPVGGLREHLVEGRVLFIGDAAGLTHPITGAGIAAAVVSGELAGKAAAAFLNDGDEEAFEDYEEDVRDQYESSVERAVERRQYLRQYWRTEKANTDAVQRKGWVAFDEYFSRDASQGAAV